MEHSKMAHDKTAQYCERADLLLIIEAQMEYANTLLFECTEE